MKARLFSESVSVALIVSLIVLGSGGTLLAAAQAQPRPIVGLARVSDPVRVSAALHSSPTMFIENAGQFVEGARFQVRGANGTIWFADNEIWVTVLARHAIDSERRRLPPLGSPLSSYFRPSSPQKGVNLKLFFVGKNPHSRLEPFNRLDTLVSYFIGNDPAKWHTDVPVWGGVRYKDLYPGMDLEIASESGQMVLRVVARPNAKLEAVRIRVEGTDKITLDGNRLQLTTAVGEYTISLLEVNNASGRNVPGPKVTAHEVASPFTSATPGLQAATADLQSNASDLFYATFLGGGSRDSGADVAVDESGAAYVTGPTNSSDFPTTPGAFDTTLNSNDAFVVKFDITGSAVTYATFLGGSGNDCYLSECAITVDANGAAYVIGDTDSTNFPTTPGAFDTTCGGCGPPNYYNDAFVAKLDATGSTLIYATLLGGSNREYGNDIDVDGSGAAYVTGTTYSSDFPTTPSAFDTTLNGSSDGFMVKLNATGSALAYATLLGGSSGEGSGSVVVDGSGAAYVTGSTSSSDFPTTSGAFDATLNGTYDGFVVKLNATGSALAYATFLGGTSWGSDAADQTGGIAVDKSGAAYVVGWTGAPDFPTTPGAFDTSFAGGTCGVAPGTYPCPDVFVVKLNAAGSALSYATFLGGSERDRGWSITVDENGAAYVTGQTSSPDFPITPGAFDTTHGGGTCGSAQENYPCPDAFIVRLNATGSALTYATFLGGSLYDYGYGIAIDESGAAYVTGWTSSSNFPVTPGAFDTTLSGIGDAFVVKLAVGNGSTYFVYLPLILRNY
jgi:hypothetical protein